MWTGDDACSPALISGICHPHCGFHSDQQPAGPLCRGPRSPTKCRVRTPSFQRPQSARPGGGEKACEPLWALRAPRYATQVPPRSPIGWRGSRCDGTAAGGVLWCARGGWRERLAPTTAIQEIKDRAGRHWGCQQSASSHMQCQSCILGAGTRQACGVWTGDASTEPSQPSIKSVA